MSFLLPVKTTKQISMSIKITLTGVKSENMLPNREVAPNIEIMISVR